MIEFHVFSHSPVSDGADMILLESAKSLRRMPGERLELSRHGEVTRDFKFTRHANPYGAIPPIAPASGDVRRPRCPAPTDNRSQTSTQFPQSGVVA